MTRWSPTPLPAAQLEIMEIVWDRGEVTVSDVREVLSPRREIARNTVQTLMTRLAEKGWLSFRVRGRTHVYSAAKPRSATLGDSVRQLVDTLFGGSAESLVNTLLEDCSLSREEAARIRAMIDQAEKRERGGKEEGR